MINIENNDVKQPVLSMKMPSPIDKTSAIRIPSSSLAYLGDSVIEILVRERLVTMGSSSPSIDSLNFVTAPAQSTAAEKIIPLLDEEEEGVFRRGRNCVHSGVPKRATPSQYRRATGLEALFGFLYLTGNYGRIRDLFSAGYPKDI